MGTPSKTVKTEGLSALLAFARQGHACRTAQKAYFRARKLRKPQEADAALAAAREEESKLDRSISEITRRGATQDVRELVLLAAAMRSAQRQFIARSGRSGVSAAREEMYAAKTAESRFDSAVMRALALEQQTLPGMDTEGGDET